MTKPLICLVNEPLLRLLTARRPHPRRRVPSRPPPPGPRGSRADWPSPALIRCSPSCRKDARVPRNTPLLLPEAVFRRLRRPGLPHCSLAPSSCLPYWLPVCRPLFVPVPAPLHALLWQSRLPGGGGCALGPESWAGGLRARAIRGDCRSPLDAGFTTFRLFASSSSQGALRPHGRPHCTSHRNEAAQGPGEGPIALAGSEGTHVECTPCLAPRLLWEARCSLRAHLAGLNAPSSESVLENF